MLRLGQSVIEPVVLLSIKGSTHFMLGFAFGYLLFRIILVVRSESFQLALYLPLLPFLTGAWFSLPYLSEVLGAGALEQKIGMMVNLFGAYGWLHHNSFAIQYLDGLNRVILICASVYLMLVWHYIALIRQLRGEHAS